jgi:UDP-3-O-[3-hydroxymyristoyl] glucosamine N-acyltransferase
MFLDIKVSELVSLLKGNLVGSIDPSFDIKKLESLKSASSLDLSVIIDNGEASVFGRFCIEEIKNTKAGVLIAPACITDFIEPDVIKNKNYIFVKDSINALNTLIELFEKNSKHNKFSLSSDGAYISSNAQIANNVNIGPGAVISNGAVIKSGALIGAQVFIGKNCSIGEHTVLYPGVKILNNCCVGSFSIVHSGTVIGSDGFGYNVNNNGLQKIPHIGKVLIGNNVEIGANCSIDRAVFDETVISDGVKIDNSVHIAHNVYVGPGTAILAQTGIAGGVKIGVGCQIGGQVAIKDHVTIKDWAKVVSKSAVMYDVKEREIVAGIPAVSFTQWKRLVVILQKLPEFFKNISINK